MNNILSKKRSFKKIVISFRSVLQGRRSVINMLGKTAQFQYFMRLKCFLSSSAVVVFAFFLCWTPFHSQRLMFVLVTLLGNWTNRLVSAQHILFMISGRDQRRYVIHICILQEFSTTSTLLSIRFYIL